VTPDREAGRVIRPYAGACLCGAVRFEIDGAFEHFYLCHCARCRKDTGSAHASNLFSSTAVLRWIDGESNVRQFALPGTLHARSFCATCGSALPSVQMNGALLVVPAGCLDGPLDIAPDAHLFVASRAAWDRELEHVLAWPTLPNA
jgi:hypothetical protein